MAGWQPHLRSPIVRENDVSLMDVSFKENRTLEEKSVSFLPNPAI
jgi:hypothetical protein